MIWMRKNCPDLHVRVYMKKLRYVTATPMMHNYINLFVY